jgi:hypothetical protein
MYSRRAELTPTTDENFHLCEATPANWRNVPIESACTFSPTARSAEQRTTSRMLIINMSAPYRLLNA